MNSASSSSQTYDASDSYTRKASMMLSYKPWAQTSSYGCMLLEMPTAAKMFCAVTLRTPPKCPRTPPKKILVTFRWLAICPCPCLVFWFGYVMLLSHAQVLPTLRYSFFTMKNSFPGVPTDISDKTKALTATWTGNIHRHNTPVGCIK